MSIEDLGPWRLAGLNVDIDGVPISVLVEGHDSSGLARRFRLNRISANPVPDDERLVHTGAPWRLVSIDTDLGGWPKSAVVASGKGTSTKIALAPKQAVEYEIAPTEDRPKPYLLPRARRWGASEPVSEKVQSIRAGSGAGSEVPVSGTPSKTAPKTVPPKLSPTTRTLLAGFQRLVGSFPKKAS